VSSVHLYSKYQILPLISTPKIQILSGYLAVQPRFLASFTNLKSKLNFISKSSSKKCVIISHGTSTDLGEMVKFSRVLSEQLKVNVLSYEYLGYGVNKENKKPSIKPSENGCYLSLKSALQYVNETLQFKNENIFL
jgi:hypothetical protein